MKTFEEIKGELKAAKLIYTEGEFLDFVAGIIASCSADRERLLKEAKDD